MKGAISVQIKNNKNEYEFTLKRNITVLCGNSGTGKTTLYNMVRNYMREGRASGVRAKTTNNVPLAVLKCAKNFAGKRIAVIADGAAFGAEIGDLAEIQKISNGTLALYLPESFEWLILKSGAVCNPETDEIVHTENYAESSKYFSWERYFFDFLAQQTASLQYAKYSKEKLNNWYAEEPAATKILSVMKGIKL